MAPAKFCSPKPFNWAKAETRLGRDRADRQSASVQNSRLRQVPLPGTKKGPRGKAQADSLRKTREETPAKVIKQVGEMYLNEIVVLHLQVCLQLTYSICESTQYNRTSLQPIPCGALKK